MSRISAELVEQAITKLSASDRTFVAIVAGETTPPELDGASWRVVISDGHWIDSMEVVLSGTRGGSRGMNVEAAWLEAQVEQRAGRFPIETRIADMAAASPLRV